MALWKYTWMYLDNDYLTLISLGVSLRPGTVYRLPMLSPWRLLWRSRHLSCSRTSLIYSTILSLPSLQPSSWSMASQWVIAASPLCVIKCTLLWAHIHYTCIHVYVLYMYTDVASSACSSSTTCILCKSTCMCIKINVHTFCDWSRKLNLLNFVCVHTVKLLSFLALQPVW